ncbi:hypothetical protein EC973_002670 [Apophysomyces ossiformis]|uniref:Uncharacterized protein n=1 Tax=Apophysomyces ossiformis TaxID=679940 RepID=A0A8H7EMF4_9FUNG|nr:hypothetical protein EC973_002670 [Apophysomyces ossiformis]
MYCLKPSIQLPPDDRGSETQTIRLPDDEMDEELSDDDPAPSHTDHECYFPSDCVANNSSIKDQQIPFDHRVVAPKVQIPLPGSYSEDQPQPTTKVCPTNEIERRSSIAEVAHSLLGNRYDDFTEKLAYIKKTIVMNPDEEEESSDIEDCLVKRDPAQRTFMEASSSNLNRPTNREHKRSDSLMSMTSSLLSMLAGPTHQEQSSHSTCPPLPEEERLAEEDEEEFEDLFGLTSLRQMGNSFLSFTDDVVGSSVRIFKEIRDTVKDANDEPAEWTVNL